MAERLTQLIATGKEMGLSGTALQEWVKEREDREREEHVKEREERAKEREVVERAKEREAVERAKEAEARTKEKEADVEIHKLRVRELELRETKGEIKEHIKPIWKPKLPPFNENVDQIDAYLARFEVHAQATEIPKTQWGSHLYTLLQGKALQACINFSKKDLEEDDKVKEVLMKRYNLTDDGYREKFHKAKPERNQPFHEFVEDITRYLMRW
uniref:Uncharacterized protein n=1 Tax=Biomphalaria glabrata TaxID=6526 RepID=A0A2C9L1F5_BIOGL